MSSSWPYALVVVVLLCLAGIFIIFSTRGEEISDRAKFRAQITAQCLTFISIVIAAFVAYRTLLTPFEPVVIARPFTWIMGPVTQQGRSLNVVMWITVANHGATPGTIDDFAVSIDLPNGRWVLEPILFVQPEPYFRMVMNKTPLDAPPAEGPFTPILLNGKSQVTKVVLFSPFSENDFNHELATAGQHSLNLYVRHSGQEFVAAKKEKIIFEERDLDSWRSGTTISGLVTQRDKPIRDSIGEAQ